MTIYYCTHTMGGTSRGVGVLMALGNGVLVTPYRTVAGQERLPWFGHVPLPLPDDVLIYDRLIPCREKGKRVTIDYEGDVDLVIDWPILSHDPSTLSMEQARAWWEWPQEGDPDPDLTRNQPRVLICRGGRPHDAPGYKAAAQAAYPHARTVTTLPREFYWPALELMLYADEVIGERQVQAEWDVIRGRADPDGAKRAASEIRKLLR